MNTPTPRSPSIGPQQLRLITYSLFLGSDSPFLIGLLLTIQLILVFLQTSDPSLVSHLLLDSNLCNTDFQLQWLAIDKEYRRGHNEDEHMTRECDTDLLGDETGELAAELNLRSRFV